MLILHRVHRVSSPSLWKLWWKDVTANISWLVRIRGSTTSGRCFQMMVRFNSPSYSMGPWLSRELFHKMPIDFIHPQTSKNAPRIGKNGQKYKKIAWCTQNRTKQTIQYCCGIRNMKINNDLQWYDFCLQQCLVHEENIHEC